MLVSASIVLHPHDSTSRFAWDILQVGGTYLGAEAALTSRALLLCILHPSHLASQQSCTWLPSQLMAAGCSAQPRCGPATWDHSAGLINADDYNEDTNNIEMVMVDMTRMMMLKES